MPAKKTKGSHSKGEPSSPTKARPNLSLITLLINFAAFFILTLLLIYGVAVFSSLQHVPSLAYKLKFFGYVVVLPLALAALIGNGIIKSLRTNKKISQGTTIISILFLVLAGYFAWKLYWSDQYPPTFFKTDDPEATYTIEQDSSNDFAVHYTTPGDANKSWVCEQELGKRERCFWEYNRDIVTKIGKSPVDLAPFLGKEVKLKGTFVYTEEQCIAEKCTPFGTDSQAQRWAAFDITTIEEK